MLIIGVVFLILENIINEETLFPTIWIQSLSPDFRAWFSTRRHTGYQEREGFIRGDEREESSESFKTSEKKEKKKELQYLLHIYDEDHL